MKKLITGAILSLISLSATAQKSDSCLKEIDMLKMENAELSKQNLYYKTTLDLLKPITSASEDNLKFDIVKIVGSKRDKTLKIFYLYTNTDTKARRFFQPTESYFVDPQGNQFKTFEVFASTDRVRVDNIEAGLPMKGVLVFSLAKAENTDFPMIKFLNLKFATFTAVKDFSVILKTFLFIGVTKI